MDQAVFARAVDMELPSAQELRQQYRRLSTDELLAIRVSGDLTKRARSLIKEELSKRGVTWKDIAKAYRRFHPTPVRGATAVLGGATVGFGLALRLYNHWEAPLAFALLAGTTMAVLVGMLGFSGVRLFGDREREEHKEAEPPPIHEVRDGYQIDDRTFRDRKDAEDYQRFIQAYREDWKKSIEFRNRHWTPWLTRKQKQKKRE